MFSQTRIRSPAKNERAIHVRLSDCHRRNSRAADGLQSHRPFPARRRRENIGASSSIMRMRELPPRPPNQQILDLCSHHVCECPARCSPLPARSLYGGAGFFWSKHGHTYADPGTGQHSGRGATQAGRNVPGRGQWRQSGLFSRQVLSLQDVRS